MEQQASILKLLFDKDLDILSLNEVGESLLSIAVESDNAEIMDMLRDHDPRVLNVPLIGEQPLLSKAIIHGKERLIRWLLDAGALVNIRDGGGNTALHHAAAKGDQGIVDLLIDAGGSRAISNKKHWYSIHVAAKESNYEMFSLLFKLDSTILAGDFLSTVFLLASNPLTGNVRILHDVLQLSPDVDLDINGATALLWFVETGQTDPVKMLLDNGADVYRRDAGNGYSALGLTVRVGH